MTGLEDYKIMNMEARHISQVLRIADQELGEGYLEYQQVDEYLSKSNECVCKIVQDRKNEVIGFCLCKVVSLDKLEGYLKLKEEQLPSYVQHSQRIGVIKTVGVKKQFQRHGIGFKLVEDCYMDIKSRGVEVICSVPWKNGDKVNKAQILENIGFEETIVIDDYWREDSIQSYFWCPACGAPPCRCSAVMYFKAV